MDSSDDRAVYPVDVRNGVIKRDGVLLRVHRPGERDAFNEWLRANGDRDPYHPEQHYDLYGAFRAGLNRVDKNGRPFPLQRDAKTGKLVGGHLPDTYKLPGHPTFSVESRYYRKGMPAGKWVDGKYVPIDR